MDNNTAYWQCASCTFSENPRDFLACSVCNTARVAASGDAFDDVSGEEHATHATENSEARVLNEVHRIIQTMTTACGVTLWTCQTCTFADNSSDILCCETCGATKAEGTEHKDATKMVDYAEQESRPIQREVLVAMLKVAETTAFRSAMVEQQDLKNRLLEIFSNAPQDDVEIRILIAMIIASLLQTSDGILEGLDTAQQGWMRNCVDCLCGVTRDIKIYKPTQAQQQEVSLEVAMTQIIYQGEMARAILARGPVRTAVALTGTAAAAAAANDGDANYIFAQVTTPISQQRRAALATVATAASLDTTGVSSLLSKLATIDHDPTEILDTVVQLMNMAEKDPPAREQMLNVDAFDALLIVYEDCHNSQKETRNAVALTMAYLLRSCFPKMLPMATTKRRAILSCLDILRDAKRGISILGHRFSVQTLAYAGNQARNYFTLMDRKFQKKEGPDSKIGPVGQLKSNVVFSAGGAAMNIETAVFVLGSTNPQRKLSAAVVLMKYAKENDTQRALMQNYGVFARLLDILRIEDTAENLQFKIVAALAIAFIVPMLDHSVLTPYGSELRDALAVLAPYSYSGTTVQDATISGQDVQWARDNLNGSLEGLDTEGAPRNAKLSASTESVSSSPLQTDLPNLFYTKDIVGLLGHLRADSCRMIDAELALFALAKADKEYCKSISSEGLDILLNIFFRGPGTSDDVRLVAAMIVARLAPVTPKCSEETRKKMTACTQILEENEATSKRMEIRATNLVGAPSGFNFRPTLYNYIARDGLVWMITLNSLGFKCESESWLWEDINKVEMDPREKSAVLLSTNGSEEDPCKFILLDDTHAQKLKQDVDGRLSLFQSTHKSLHKDGLLATPLVLDIAYADRPDFFGVSVHHLSHHLMQQFTSISGISSKSNFYQIENLDATTGFFRQKGESVFCPVDGKMGAAYVHCIEGADHVGLANHMLSWTWSYSVGEVVDTLESYCEDNKLDPKRTYVWICAFCLNQHRVVQSGNSGISNSSSDLDFETEFEARVLGIGRVLVMMRPWKFPNLKRSWCVFEIFMALTKNCEVSIVMPSREKENMINKFFYALGNSSDHGIDFLYKALNQVDVEKAEASVEQDRTRILGLIEEQIGCQTVNLLVQDRLRVWIRSLLGDLVEEDANKPADEDESPELARAATISRGVFLKKVGDVFDLYGDYAAASDVYRKCLELREAVFGSNHLDVAEAYEDRGRALFSQRSNARSLGFYLKALRIRENILGKTHLQTATTYFRIGVLLQQMGDTDEAMAMMRKCLAIQESERTGDHRDTALTCAYVGLLLGESGKDGAYEQGMQTARKALARLKEFAGVDHPDTGFCYGVMASILQESSLDEAQANAEKCCAIQEIALGIEHPSVAKTYDLLGSILRQKNMQQAAMTRFRQALKIHETTSRSADNQIAMARTCANMSAIAVYLGKIAEARQYHAQVLSALQHSINGLTTVLDQDLIIIYSATGEEFYENKDWDTAIILFRQGLDVMEAMLGTDHPDLAAGHEAVGLAMYNKGDYRGAMQEYERCLSIRRTEMVEDSPEVLAITQLVAGATTQWLERKWNRHTP